jgi:hypothetical protein
MKLLFQTPFQCSAWAAWKYHNFLHFSSFDHYWIYSPEINIDFTHSFFHLVNMYLPWHVLVSIALQYLHIDYDSSQIPLPKDMMNYRAFIYTS